MDLETLRHDLADDTNRLTTDLAADIKAECVHIADPAQCGSIVQRHLNGLLSSLLLFVVILIAVAAAGIYLYTRH